MKYVEETTLVGKFGKDTDVELPIKIKVENAITKANLTPTSPADECTRSLIMPELYYFDTAAINLADGEDDKNEAIVYKMYDSTVGSKVPSFYGKFTTGLDDKAKVSKAVLNTVTT